jgi:hypothetical protein
VHRINNERLPGLPSLAQVKEQERLLAIGQWNREDPIDNPLPPEQLASRFANGAFPIGSVVLTTDRKDSLARYSGRRVSLHHALIWLTVQGVHHKLLKLPPNGAEVTLSFGVWPDGVSCLKHPVLVMLAFLIWNPDYSNPTRLRWNDTVRQYPVYIGVQPETYDTVISIMQQVHFEATTAHLPSLNWCGYTFHYRSQQSLLIIQCSRRPWDPKAEVLRSGVRTAQ